MGRTYKDRRTVEFSKKSKNGMKNAAQHKEDKKYRNQKNHFRDILGEMIHDQEMDEIYAMDTSEGYSEYNEEDDYFLEDYPIKTGT